MDVPSSENSSHFPLEPIAASVLAAEETRRRDAVKALGACRSGCADLDGYVLAGGFERGCVVGLSAEEEDRVGVSLGLQVLVQSIFDGAVDGALVITPKPTSVMLAALRNGIRAGLAGGGEDAAALEPAEVARRTRECLDCVMLSQVFDMDGLWEVLADLDKPDDAGHVSEDGRQGLLDSVDKAPREEGEVTSRTHEPRSPVREIQDSQDEDEDEDDENEDGHGDDASPPPHPKQPVPQEERDPATRTAPARALPGIILITHFSTLLTSLFTHRDKAAARTALQLLSSHLRYLSRALSSRPLILLLNSTAATPSPTDAAAQPARHPDPTLRSIFNPPSLPVPGRAYAAASATASRRNKPSFGLTFSQLLDVHLLCTRVPRSKDDAEAVAGGDRGGSISAGASPRFVTAVEVLLDEIGVWEGGKGPRRRREQRWAAVDVVEGRIVDAFEDEKDEGHYEQIRLAGGFGGRRV